MTKPRLRGALNISFLFGLVQVGAKASKCFKEPVLNVLKNSFLQ